MGQLAVLPLGPGRFAVRRATAGDLPAIVGLLADDELGATREAGTDPDLTSYRTAFAAIDGDPGQLLLVATAEDGQAAATMQLTFIPGLARQGDLHLGHADRDGKRCGARGGA